MDPHFLPRSDAEEVGRTAAVDRDRDVSVRILVEDDVTPAGVGERARSGRVVTLEGKLELYGDARQHARLLEVVTREVELHVPEMVDVEDAGTDAVLADLSVGHVQAHERLRVDRRAEVVDRDAAREMSGGRR